MRLMKGSRLVFLHDLATSQVVCFSCPGGAVSPKKRVFSGVAIARSSMAPAIASPSKRREGDRHPLVERETFLLYG
jgi:hypothetical protein